MSEVSESEYKGNPMIVIKSTPEDKFPFQFGVKYTSYATWDLGVGFTYKVLTLDLRYYDTNLNKAQCNVFTSAQNATFSPGNITPANPTGLGTNWCSAAFIAKLSASVDFASNLK